MRDENKFRAQESVKQRRASTTHPSLLRPKKQNKRKTKQNKTFWVSPHRGPAAAHDNISAGREKALQDLVITEAHFTPAR